MKVSQAVGRALVLNPRLLLLDEPLEGLAPIIVEELLRAIARITRDEGLSAIIVEQHPKAILAISHRAVVLDHGTVVHSGPADELSAAPELLDRLLGVARARRTAMTCPLPPSMQREHEQEIAQARRRLGRPVHPDREGGPDREPRPFLC